MANKIKNYLVKLAHSSSSSSLFCLFQFLLLFVFTSRSVNKSLVSFLLLLLRCCFVVDDISVVEPLVFMDDFEELDFILSLLKEKSEIY